MHVQLDDQDLNNDIQQEQHDDNDTIHSNSEQNPIVDIPVSDCPVNFGQNQIIVNSVLHSPSRPKITILFEKKKRLNVQISENNFEQDVIDFVKNYISPDIQYYIYFEKPQMYEPFSAVLQRYFKWPSIKFKRCTKKLIDVTNKDEIEELIKNYHESKSNHRGIDETYLKMKDKYYWPNVKSSIQTYINECEICQQSKYERNPVRIKMNVTPTATKPFEIIHLDTFTFEQSKFLTIVDSFSKYAQAYFITSLTGTEIANNLLQFFSHHGIPKQIIVDNGTEFKNSLISELLGLHKVKVHFCTPNHPQSNGVIERFHSTITEHIRLLNTQGFLKTPIKMKMMYAILAYNHSIHSTTKMKPIDVVNGHISDNDPFDIQIDQILLNDYVNEHKEKSKLLYSKINSDLIQNKEKVIERENKNRENPEIFQPQQKVYVRKHIRQKNANKFNKPTTIKTVNNEMKTISTDQQDSVHMDNLKRPLKTSKN